MTALVHVSPEHPFVVLNPENPEVLTSIIPGVRPVSMHGQQVWAVPHTLDATRVLRNLGAPVPSPILSRYRWTGRYAPFAAQRETAAFATLNSRAYILNDMGTGKTLAVLWAYDYLRSIGVLHKAIVFAPLSTLDAVWGAEITLNFPHLRFAVLHASASRRLRLLANDFDVYIINHDGVQIVADALAARTDIDLAIIDEASTFRAHGTRRWKEMRKVTSPPARWVWAMTGTPTPNEPTDAWAQAMLVTPHTVPKYFRRFRDMTMRQVTAFKWEEKPDAMATVSAALRPSIRFSREQCVDLPPTVFQTRTVSLSPEQQQAYDQMRTSLRRMVLEQGTVRAVNAADQAMKLVQVACGAVRDSATGEPILLPNTSRVSVVKEIIEQAQGKVIVFVPFVAGLEALRDELAAHWPTELVYGETPAAKRAEIFAAFQRGTAQQLRVLVANARVMSHGLTLTAADTVIWFAPTTSHETFDQACHRIIRPGQKRTTLVVMLEGTPAERKLYKRLQTRAEMQDVLLDIVEAASVTV